MNRLLYPVLVLVIAAWGCNRVPSETNNPSEKGASVSPAGLLDTSTKQASPAEEQSPANEATKDSSTAATRAPTEGPGSSPAGESAQPQEGQSTEQGQSDGSDSAGAGDEQSQTSGDAMALGEEPLLLLDNGLGNGHEGLAADNSRCFVCHLNYQFEEIAVVHAKEGYGCAYCHGQSDAHIADESWASGGNGTAPDVMYRPDEVIPACLKCHELSKSDPECRCEFPRLPEKKRCTDCHGDHRLKERKCRWK